METDIPKQGAVHVQAPPLLRVQHLGGVPVFVGASDVFLLSDQLLVPGVFDVIHPDQLRPGDRVHDHFHFLDFLLFVENEQEGRLLQSTDQRQQLFLFLGGIPREEEEQVL